MKHQDRVTPWAEAILSLALSIVLFLFKKTELAEVSIIVGPALSISRFYINKKIEDEMEVVHVLAKIVDLQHGVSARRLQDILRIYFEITEPEFLQVKDTALAETTEKLLKLAQQKTSDELPTSTYYNWLLPMLEAAPSGSEVWAISMMLDCEWDNSPAEEQFLDLNIKASKRGVKLERIFVVSRQDIPKIADNKGVKAHLNNTSSTLTALVVEKEWLQSREPRLLKAVGDGLIAFDRRVALINVSSSEGIRGHVTMHQGEIIRLRQIFDDLRVHARGFKDVVDGFRKS